ncbi:MAG TPA: hypothetical protein PLU30_10550 [Verrucomicrobiae bacterium]|nr:hypothetical protein [Verrucomicrobiae bacterium]
MEGPPQEEASARQPGTEAPASRPGPVGRRWRWLFWVLGAGAAGLLLVCAAAWILVFRPVWILRPLMAAVGGRGNLIGLDAARWVSAGEIEVLGLAVGGSNRVGSASMTFDYRELIGLEPPHEGGDRETLRLTDVSVGGLGKLGSANLKADLGQAVAAAMNRDRGTVPAAKNPAELVLSDIALFPTGRVESVRMRFDLGDAIASLRDPVRWPGRGANPVEISISGIALDPTGRVDTVRVKFDLGGVIAQAMGPSNAAMVGSTNLADINLSGLSMGSTGRVEAVRARVDLGSAIAAAMDPSRVAMPGSTGLTEIAVSGIALGPTGRIESVSVRLDLADAVAAAIRPDAATPDKTNLTDLVVSGISLGDSGRIRSVRARFDPSGVIRALRQAARSGGQPELAIDEVVIDQPHLSISREEILDVQQRSAARETPLPGGPLIEIGRVQVREGLVQVKNLGPSLPPLPIPIDQVISNVVFGASRDHRSATKPLTIHVRDWTLRSPYDPLATVLRLKNIDISFSVRGLLENRLDSIEFVEPTIYVGQDLFWFSDLLKKETSNLPQGKPWTVGKFGIRGGRVIVATQGETDLELPLVFTSSQKDMRFGSLEDMHMSAAIDVVPVSLDYRERYGIAVDNLRGKLEFALPREQGGANNVVNTLKADRIAWRNLASSNTWVSVTFDVNGVYGRFGGEGYGGYVNGDATLLFKDAREWVASVAATKVDLGGVADAIVPEYVRLTGRGNGALVVRGCERTIRECSGKFGLLDKGRLEIMALDELLKRLPVEWEATKKDLAGIVLSAFRTYHYTSGETDFLYKPPQSYLRAHFRGAEGKRDFDVTYQHDSENQPN